MILLTQPLVVHDAEVHEVVGRAALAFTALSMSVPSMDAVEFEIVDVVIRRREVAEGEKRAERSLLVGEGAMSAVIFSECSFRPMLLAPTGLLPANYDTVTPEEELVARVRCTSRVAPPKAGLAPTNFERTLRLTFEVSLRTPA